MRTRPLPGLVLGALLLVCTPLAQAQRGGGDRPGGKEKGSIQSYDELLPADETETDPGLVTVHTRGESVYYEIPPALLGQDLLWVTQLAATASGTGYGGSPVTNQVVRWELRGEKVLLRDVDYDLRASSDDPVRNAVEKTSVAPILHAFDVQAWGKDRAPVIEVGEFFTSDPDAFSPKRRINASRIDSKRSFMEQVKSFPTNVEVKVLATYELESQRGGGDGAAPRRRGPSRDEATVVLHHSMVALPAEPMTPRREDERVGFFSVSHEDYGTDEHAVERVSYITRWRLEKQDPEAEVSDPVRPIVFYVGRGVPERWRPYVKQGIEAWQGAFEAAGFSNAILAKDPPSRAEDPDWDAEDARYSVIRWLPSTIENAMGPHVHDPRTGEILEADILMYHNVLKLCRDWYFVQASPNDPRAQDLPLPDDLMGELLAYVVTHEVGHSLGFPHNMKASSSFTVEQLRDPVFTAENGVEASIMDYGRFNYVAQPGDGARLIPRVGPYDRFAVQWGYAQYADEEAEAAGLAALLARQLEDPVLRFGGPNAGEDPSQQTEDLGSDPILATTLGLANIDRVAGYLVEACCEPGEDYELLENMWGELLGQRDRELMHVANLIGGFRQKNLWYGDADVRWDPVPLDEQQRALAFLHEHAFRAPASLLTPELLYRLETSGAAERVLSGQRRLLGTLMDDERLLRMAEQLERTGTGYEPVRMLQDLTRGLWSELLEEAPRVGLYRRNLQRAHAEALIEAAQELEVSSDLPALARGELTRLRAMLSRRLAAAGDETSRRHVEDMLVRIDMALEPRSATEAVQTVSAGFESR